MPRVVGLASTNIDNVTIKENVSGQIYVVEDSLSLVPIGAILPWAKSLTGVPSLPEHFVECNGQTLDDEDSLLDGQTIPDLNGDNRFLRGDSSSGNTGGSETHTHTQQGSGNTGGSGYPTPANRGESTASASTLPTYYSVVWIMRVK